MLTMTGIAVLTIIPFTPLVQKRLCGTFAAYFAYLIPGIPVAYGACHQPEKAYVRHYGELL